MIKMVVSDMDGTLLKKGEDFISDEIINYINRIKDKGIKFVIASGRQYGELLYLTKGISDIYYICSDGGCIIYNGEIIYKKEIDVETGYKLKEDIIFHGCLNSYCTKINKKAIEDYKGRLKRVENIDEIKNIVKISAYGGSFVEAPFGTYEIYKDKNWREWIKNNAGKGQAVEFLKSNKIKTSETAVIGDNFNDMGMMRCGKYRFAMKDAPNQLKMLCGNRTYEIQEVLELLSEGNYYE